MSPPATPYFSVPSMWHRYKPDDLTGWHEHWVGFAGTGAEQVFHAGLFKEEKPRYPDS